MKKVNLSINIEGDCLPDTHFLHLHISPITGYIEAWCKIVTRLEKHFPRTSKNQNVRNTRSENSYSLNSNTQTTRKARIVLSTALLPAVPCK